MKEKKPCQYCGTSTGNRKMHEKYCFKNPDSIKKAVPTQTSTGKAEEPKPQQESTNQNNGSLVVETAPGVSKREPIDKPHCSRSAGLNDKSQSSSAAPLIHNPPSSPSDVGTPDTLSKTSWLDKVMGRIAATKDPMNEYKNFFGKMPKFEAKPPGFFKKLLLKKGVEYKNFVFVDKDGYGEVAFLPYDVAKERVVVDKVGYWPIKVKGDTVFLSKEKLLPLADAPDLSRFQNSANYVWSVYNGGYQEGISQRFDELMDEINKDRIFKWMCLAVAVLALIALAVTVYTDGRTINALISVNNVQYQQLINLTKVH